MELKRLIETAAGREPADLVLRNGRIVNVFSGEIHDGDVAIAGDRIAGVGRYEGRDVFDLGGQLLCPGFIDGHVHIESSMLSVPEFARVVAARGTTAVVIDPHEIANVMGTEGIRYMLASSKYCPIHVYVMVSSCVPASPFESGGAEISAEDMEPILADPWVIGIAEMMNYPGVVAGDDECLAKIAIRRGRPVDGHAPGLTGHDLSAYAAAGIGSDHECTTLEEAREKLRLGMMIMIREGSQARNLSALVPLVTPQTADRFMFVTDDKDVEDLITEGHIDYLVRRAIEHGIEPVLAVRMASLGAARYFGLDDLGAIAPGRLASFAVLENFESCRVTRAYHAGRLSAVDGVATDPEADKRKTHMLRSSMNVRWLEPEQFRIPAPDAKPRNVHVIEVLEDRIDTLRSVQRLEPVDGALEADPARDLCKIAVIERHHASGRIGRGFVKGFGLGDGAIASSVGHDSHNLIVAGTNDADMFAAAVDLVKRRGGLNAVRGGQVLAAASLPIAGLMSDANAESLRAQLAALREVTADMGIVLRRPFMALSFLSLSVIGALKVTDRGLVDVTRFELVDLIDG